MVTKQWVAVHRKHHAKCETEDDPHSPQVYGINKVLWEGVDLYTVAATNKADLDKYGVGTPDDWIERNVYARYPELGPTLLAFISIALFGVVGVALWALQMVWIPFWAAGVVNGIGHWWGYRNFESADTSTNLSPWGVIGRRRRAAQQPPCVPELGAFRAAQLRVRYRLGADLRVRGRSGSPRSCASLRRSICVRT